MNVKWQEKIPDTSILDRAGIPSIDTILMKTQIHWAGHIVRMPDHRLPKLLLYGQIKEGKRSQGGQKKRYKDTLKISLKAFGIKHDTWEDTARNRATWRLAIQKGATSCEASRTAAAQQRRLDRKARADNIPTTAGIPCPHCSRIFRARIGLISHLRTHEHKK